MAKTRAEAKAAGYIPAFEASGDLCMERSLEDAERYCSADPLRPYLPGELAARWFIVPVVPVLSYGLLRTLAWIFRGFGRDA
jgi:hypothetical protein